MIGRRTAALLAVLLLHGCGQGSAPAADQMPTAEELGMPETAELEFVADGRVQAASAALYIGEGYSLYVPDAGWRRESEQEDRIPVDVWESTENDGAEVAVFRYGAVPLQEAVTDFLEEHDDYVFPELLLDAGEAKEPLEGVDEEGTVLKFITRAGKEGTYIVSWEYRDALGSAASQAEQIARSFTLI